MHDTAVIIPLYNGAAWIESTLAAVASQTRKAAEIVVVDDGSQDDSVQRARPFTGVRVLRNPGKGPRAARNFGLQQSQSELVAFLDQDDIWHPTHLDRLTRVLESHPTAMAASAGCMTFGNEAELTWTLRDDSEIQCLDPWTNFPFGSVRCPSMVLARRRGLTRIGGWNDATRHVADVELWLRLAGEGELLSSDAATVGVRSHDDSYSGRLRSDRLEEYLQALSETARILAAERASRFSDQQDWLQRRLGIVETFRHIAASVMANDVDGAIASVESLSSRLDDEPQGFAMSAWHTFAWFLAPPGATNGRRRFLARLHAQWPAGAPEGREVLWSTMSTWPRHFFFTHFLHRPWQKHRRYLLQRAWRAKQSAGPRMVAAAGLDADGWAQRNCLVRVAPQSRCRALCIGVELPGWTDCGPRRLVVTIAGRPAMTAMLPCGRFDVTLPVGGAAELLIEFASDLDFAMPGEERRRSLRIVKLQATRDEPGAVTIEPVRVTGRVVDD